MHHPTRHWLASHRTTVAGRRRNSAHEHHGLSRGRTGPLPDPFGTPALHGRVAEDEAADRWACGGGRSQPLRGMTVRLVGIICEGPR